MMAFACKQWVPFAPVNEPASDTFWGHLKNRARATIDRHLSRPPFPVVVLLCDTLSSEAVTLPLRGHWCNATFQPIDRRSSRRFQNCCHQLKYFLAITNESPDYLSFDEGFKDGRYRLIQVTKELAEHVRQGKTFIVRGQPNTNLCFCTDDATYRVREVETTDTMFITNVNAVESIGTGKDYKIRAYLKTFLELTKDEMSPYLALKTLLEKYEYDLNDSNAEETITFDEVLEIIQFSEAEIRAAMERLPVVEYEGLFRYLKRSFREVMLGKLVDVIDDYTIYGISTKEMDQFVMREFFRDEYPIVFIDWLHRTYAMPNGTPNHLAICRDRAVELLSKENSLGITAFERKMSNLLPIGTEFDSTALKGVAIIKNTVGWGQIVEYLNVEDMPPDPKQRFAIVFQVNPSWSAEEIEPYVVDFYTSKATVGAFLHKNCQSVKEGNVKGGHARQTRRCHR